MATENIIIIGGGPAGLAAAIYTARAELSPLVLAGSPAGSQLSLTNEVENYPGMESILGPQLIMNMRKHATKFNARFADEIVTKVDFSKSPFSLTTSKKTYDAKTVIVASGASTKWLGLRSEQQLRGRGVSSCAICDGFFYKGKNVAVVGGGDTAMEEALTLSKFAKKVYVVHRRSEFRASKIMQRKVLNNPKVEIIWNAVVGEVLGKEKVEGISLKKSDVATGDFVPPEKLEIDGLFVAIGHEPNTKFLQNSGLLMGEKGYLYTSTRYALEKANSEQQIAKAQFDFNFKCMTNIPGVFAAGDVADFSYKQVATSVGSGVAAALEVEKYLEQ